jgi:dCMP deaminase
MRVAKSIAQASEATKLKVGAVAVKGDMIIGDGYNGTPCGFHTNACEFPEPKYTLGESKLKTRPETIHAEMNMLAKITRSNNSSMDCTVFCTHSPCIKCAIHMHQAGVKELYYEIPFKHQEGIEFLINQGVKVNVRKY